MCLSKQTNAVTRICSTQGMTPLHWASDHGEAACVQALLSAGADVAAKVQTRSNRRGRIRLYHTYSRLDASAMSLYRIPRKNLLGPITLLQDHDGQTPLHYGELDRHPRPS